MLFISINFIQTNLLNIAIMGSFFSQTQKDISQVQSQQSGNNQRVNSIDSKKPIQNNPENINDLGNNNNQNNQNPQNIQNTHNSQNNQQNIIDKNHLNTQNNKNINIELVQNADQNKKSAVENGIKKQQNDSNSQISSFQQRQKRQKQQKEKIYKLKLKQVQQKIKQQQKRRQMQQKNKIQEQKTKETLQNQPKFKQKREENVSQKINNLSSVPTKRKIQSQQSPRKFQQNQNKNYKNKKETQTLSQQQYDTKKSHIYKKINKYPIQKEGLPNIGNTCFLNSIIQLLFSSEKLRQIFLDTETNQDFISRSYNNSQMKLLKQDNIYGYFKQIFYNIAYSQSRQQKRATMQKIVRYLYQKNINYQSFSQQDSFQFMLFLLKKLFSYNKSLFELFNINFLHICKQCKNKNKIKIREFQQITIDQMEFTCKQCHQTNNITFLNQPKIILFIAKNHTEVFKQLVYFQNLKNFKKDPFPFDPSNTYLVYKLKAKILYSGNGRSGHYIAARRKIHEDNQYQNGQFYQFNDSSIHHMERTQNYNYSRNYNYSNFNQKICLYELCQIISQKQYQKRKRQGGKVNQADEQRQNEINKNKQVLIYNNSKNYQLQRREVKNDKEKNDGQINSQYQRRRREYSRLIKQQEQYKKDISKKNIYLQEEAQRKRKVIQQLQQKQRQKRQFEQIKNKQEEQRKNKQDEQRKNRQEEQRKNIQQEQRKKRQSQQEKKKNKKNKKEQKKLYLNKKRAEQQKLTNKLIKQIMQQKQQIKRRSTILSCCLQASKDKNQKKEDYSRIQKKILILYFSQINLIQNNNSEFKQLFYWKIVKSQNEQLQSKYLSKQQVQKIKQTIPKIIEKAGYNLPTQIKEELINQFKKFKKGEV